MAPMNNSMLAALGISRTGDLRTGRIYSGYGQPPCAPCDAARRRMMDRGMAGFGGFRGFGALKVDPAAPLADFYGRTDDRWDIWMNEAARTWARVTGNTDEAIVYRNRGVQLNNAFGNKSIFESCASVATALPNSTEDCKDIPLAGLACRGLPANFHPCESVVRGGTAGAVASGTQQFVASAQQAWESASGQQPSAGPTGSINTAANLTDLLSSGSLGIPGTLRDSLNAAAARKSSILRMKLGDTKEDVLGVEKPKGNTALLVGGVLAVGAALFLLRK